MSTTIHHQHRPAIRYVCPDWCVGADTDRHESPKARAQAGDPHSIDVYVGHDGPTFGSWSCTADQNITTGQLVPDVTFDSVRNTFTDPAELRQHIADAQAALAWLEATTGEVDGLDTLFVASKAGPTRGKRERTSLKEAIANVRMNLRAIRQPDGIHLGTLVLSTESRVVRENRDGFRLGFMTAKMIEGTATDDELIDAGLKSPRHAHSA